MLSIAIKNSVLLALVILIAHFLLKNSAQEQLVLPREGSNQISKVLLTPKDSGQLSRSTNVDQVTKGAMRGDDLYSYVYGQTLESAPKESSGFKPPAPAVVQAPSKPSTTALGMNEAIGGILVGYEGSGDQWADV